MAADTTIAPLTITADGGSSGTTEILTFVSVPNYYYVGQQIGAIGTTPAGISGGPYTITGTTATTITFTIAGGASVWTSGGTVFLWCGNRTNDALSSTQYVFANSYSVPAGSLGVRTSKISIGAQLAFFNTSPAAGAGFQLDYNGSNSKIYLSTSNFTPTNLNAGQSGELTWDSVALSSSLLSTTLKSLTLPGSSTPANIVNFYKQPVAVSTSAVHTFQLLGSFAATGVASGTYTSGITATGTVGQTCALTSFNNSSTATATVALTGTNTIAGGTALAITSRGTSATAAPTSATAGNGTATCSGTATIAAVLGGSPGNAMLLYSLLGQ